MNNKGFTLIELLAVIVILSIISIITIPLVVGVVQKIQQASYKESLRSVFSATDLYIATNAFTNFPDDGIEVTDEEIRLRNKSFTSGKIIKNQEGEFELEKVTNGYYCGSGTIDNLIIIEGSCDSLDETPPMITIGASTVVSSSITIVADAEDLESGINGYQFSNDNGLTWTSKQTSNVYTFIGLTSNTSYTFKVKVYNNNLLSTESDSLEVTTNNILVPTYSINTTNWTQSAVVTITYPERQPGYVYEYSLDEGLTWEEVLSPATTKDITFNSNGNVIARIGDGTNIVSGITYEVTNIDTTPPIITINPTAVTIGEGETYVDMGISATDNADGDITGSIITTGSVDTSIIGTYTLTYNVVDTAGNAATSVTRTVEVINLFDPSDIVNLYLWLDADQITLNENDPVSTWSDMSGNNLNLVQSSSGYKPTFITNGLNGKPIVRFDGSNDFMYIPSSNSLFKFLHSGSGSTVFIVTTDSGMINARSTVLSTFTWSNLQVGFGFEIAPDTNESRIWIQNNQNPTDNWLIARKSITGYGGSNIYSIRHGSTLSPDFEFSKNGVVGSSSNYYGSPVSSNSTTNLCIGAFNDGTYAYHGDIAEIIIYNRSLSNTERDDIENYLSNKWGISLGS